MGLRGLKGQGDRREMDACRVSVVVPVYNTGEPLHDLVASLDGQSMPQDDFEVIFVDDGSTDGTGQLLDELAADHPNWVVRHIPNSGWPGTPRNVGLDLLQLLLYARAAVAHELQLLLDARDLGTGLKESALRR